MEERRKGRATVRTITNPQIETARRVICLHIVRSAEVKGPGPGVALHTCSCGFGLCGSARAQTRHKRSNVLLTTVDLYRERNDDGGILYSAAQVPRNFRRQSRKGASSKYCYYKKGGMEAAASERSHVVAPPRGHRGGSRSLTGFARGQPIQSSP